MSNKIQLLSQLLKLNGCNGCELGCQPNLKQPVIYKGNLSSKIMWIGEGAGKQEELAGIPFVGPAGELLDKIITSMGFDPKQFYFGNATKCRYIAPAGSGRENLTPTKEHIDACRAFIQFEISELKPELIVLVGKVAAQSVLDIKPSTPLKDLAGRFITDDKYPGIQFFTLYHPSWILHCKSDPERYKKAKNLVWEHCQKLRDYIKEKQLYETI